ncbi:MAG: T9SS type A sorting domain-containing protein [Chitinophagales bacterium]
MISTSLFGQNFSIFPNAKDVTYETYNEQRYFVRSHFENVTDGDSAFLFQNKLDTVSFPAGDCLFGTKDTCLLGPRYLKMNDGTEVLFNSAGDSIFFKPDAAVNEEWIMYTYANGDAIKARYIFPLYGTIFGETSDSLKRINLEVFTEDGTHIEDSRWWNERFDMTKEHGMSRFFDINSFPAEDDTATIRLAGTTNPRENIVDISSHVAFDYGLGYEFHYREEAVPNNEGPGDKRISAWKYFVINKSEDADAFHYTMERIRFDTIYFDGVPTSNVIWDTVDVTYSFSDYAFLDTLEFSLFQNVHYGYSDWNQDSTQYKGIAYKDVYDWYDYDATEHCLTNTALIDIPEQRYGDGLGLMHYLDSTDAEHYYAFDMVYFQVGLLQWGTPYDFSVLDLPVEDTYAKTDLAIFPNPASTEIHCVLPDDVGIRSAICMSMDGKNIPVAFYIGADGMLTISVDAVNPGIYMLQIQSAENLYIGKFIKL